MHPITKSAVLATFSGCFLALSACNLAWDDPALGVGDQALSPCDAVDTNCAPSPDDNGEVDDGDDSGGPATDSCTAQEAFGEEGCDMLFGIKYDGTDCVTVSGCSCKGADCGSLFSSAEACKQAFGDCPSGGTPTDCEVLAAELVDLLAKARSCNMVNVPPVEACSILLPTLGNCPVPANATSDAAQAYLELFAKYAKMCPLPVPACPDKQGVAMGCVQGPDIDGLGGICDFLDGSIDTD